MKSRNEIQLSDVQGVYSGPEFELWELIMGQQIHIGGLKSSTNLAKKASIGEGTTGVDLCCCTGAGMRSPAAVPECRKNVWRGRNGRNDRMRTGSVPGRGRR